MHRERRGRSQHRDHDRPSRANKLISLDIHAYEHDAGQGQRCGAAKSMLNHPVDDLPVEAQGRAMTDRLDIVFAALADPTRRRILVMLLEDDMAVTDVAEPFEMSLAAISKHLAVLTGAGLVSRERHGRVTWCKLEPDAMREASVWMQAFGLFEAVDLDAFERFLAAELGEA
jgi:DNA-binding transcriptional ArsR family regulator